jgi:hypothetical protein
MPEVTVALSIYFVQHCELVASVASFCGVASNTSLYAIFTSASSIVHELANIRAAFHTIVNTLLIG